LVPKLGTACSGNAKKYIFGFADFFHVWCNQAPLLSYVRLIEDMLKRTILEEAEWSSEEREDMERRLGRIRLITLQILTGGNESPGLEVRCRNIETHAPVNVGDFLPHIGRANQDQYPY